MKSPGQFDHPLVARAKCAIAAAALGQRRRALAQRHDRTARSRRRSSARMRGARASEFGYLRMWSIHPNQVQPDLRRHAARLLDEVEEAAAILARRAGLPTGGRSSTYGRLHDRASYRYYWELLARAHATGMELPAGVQQQFFSTTHQPS
jgi:citrate lyase subunit beta/citryl-CoA lyase